MQTYTEIIKNNDQLFKLHSKLKSKNFEQTADGYWTEIWENPETNEQVIINRVES